jgi:putative IMPACT (imprinted ancient) family translation regulator
MLTTLLHGEVGEIVAVCTRYFGGTKLGTGGLARAYSGGVKLALEALPRAERVERVALLLRVDYESVDPVKRMLAELDAAVVSETYAQEVEFTLAVPAESAARLRDRLAGITRGQGRIEALEEGERG